MLQCVENRPNGLLDTIHVPLSKRQESIMRIIDEEDYTPVVSKVVYEMGLQGKTPTQDYLDEGILALKQYYAICFMDDNAHAISDTLDPFWHAHILHTVPYHRFSERLGIGYMHHAPNDPNNPEETVALRILYDHTQKVFRRCFNWVSDEFNPIEVRDEGLLCSHYSQNSFVQPGDIAYPRDAKLAAAEAVFVRSRQIPQV